MRSSLATRFGVAISLLLVAACGSQDPDGEVLESAVRPEPRACLAARPVTLGAGTLTLTGDTRRLPARESPCDAGGPAVYYTFTLTRTSAFYADTFGSGIDATVALLSDDCVAPLACGERSCETTQSRIVQVLGPGTYHVAVAGRGDRERGPYVLHLQAVRVPGPAAGEIPRGDFELLGVLASGGGWLGDCGRALTSSWWWYASCPAESGLFRARTETVFTRGHAALWWVDVDDGQEVCAPSAGTGTAPPYDVEALDEPEGGLHVLMIGAVDAAMGFPLGEPYVVTGNRP